MVTSLLAVLLATPPAPPEEALVSLDVKEAEIADVVRVLAEVGSFQVVIDPGTACRVTLKLQQVRWAKVLDLALKSCALASEEDGGVVRIATIAKLTADAEAHRALAAAQQESAPLHVTSYRLSYARAQDLAPIIKKMLSPRGEVIYDTRTNTLIIVD
jgi:type IV pilus assembly protein PilQ